MFRNYPVDALVILLIVLLFVGPKRLPGLGRSLGSGMREFKDSITGSSSDEDRDREEPALGSGAGESSTAPGGSRPAEQPAQESAAGERPA